MFDTLKSFLKRVMFRLFNPDIQLVKNNHSRILDRYKWKKK